MARVEEYLSELVFDQLPEFVQAEYPLFADFIRAYYKFLEQDKHAQEVIQNIEYYADIEKTITELIPKFFEQYANEVPRNTQANVSIFIKRISDLYASKGTERGYNLLFNILYREAIDVFYPFSRVLKASDGKWVKTYRLFAYQADNSDPFKFENSLIRGTVSNAEAVCSSVIRYIEGRLTVYELSLDPLSIAGNFSSFEKIVANKLVRLDGANEPVVTIRDGLSDAQVYTYYFSRIDELRNLLFSNLASRDVATRRLVNLGVRYQWTEQQILDSYNELFSTTLDLISWSRTTPYVNHLSSINVSNAYDYYYSNPIELNRALTENNAFQETIKQRMITTALDFDFTPSQTALLYNRALADNTLAAVWEGFLAPVGPVYEQISAFLYPMLADVDIVNAGLGYRIGDQVVINSSTGFGAIAEVHQVDSSGAIKNVKVLRPGINYMANSQISVPRLIGRTQTAREARQNNVATLYFPQKHGLKRNDEITVANVESQLSENNVVIIEVVAAGLEAGDKTHGVFLSGNTTPVYTTSNSYAVSVFSETQNNFISHRGFDLTAGVIDYEYYNEGLEANNDNWSAYFNPTIVYINNLGNIGSGNVHLIDSSNNNARFEISNIPTHTAIKIDATVHFVGDFDNERVFVNAVNESIMYIDKPAGAAAVKSLPTVNPGQESFSYIGNLSYSSVQATDQLIFDLSKTDDITVSTDSLISDTTYLQINNPVSITETDIGAFGYDPTNPTFPGNTSENFRSITLNKKVSLEHHSQLFFEAYIGTISESDPPEAGEELRLEYSIDGTIWITFSTVSVLTAAGWQLVTATVPLPARTPTGVYLRFYQNVSDAIFPAPRDTWAFTSVVSGLSYKQKNYGRAEISTGWLSHTDPVADFIVSCQLDETDEVIYLSNVVVSIRTDPSLAMADYINSLTGNDMVIVHTWKDAGPNRLENGLKEAMLSIGASQEVFVNTIFALNSAYVLIGKVNGGAGTGLERLGSFTDNDPSNFARLKIKIDDGKLLGETFAVRSIPDYQTVQYTSFGPDDDKNVNVLLETSANLKARIAPLVISEPFWKNNDGMLSEETFVQGRTRTAREEDPVYWQTFSYVIRSEHPIDQWRRYATDLMHPAGMQLFGELRLQTLQQNVIDVSPKPAGPIEIQDYFAITADKADRTHPLSPEFRVDMTAFPERNEFNPTFLQLNETAYAVSQTQVASDYVTAECFFKRLPDTPSFLNIPRERILFCKNRSWAVRTDGGRLQYRIQTYTGRLFDWYWVDTGTFIQDNIPYVLALSYDGSFGRLYLNGELISQEPNSVLRRNRDNSPGVLANQNAYWPKLNSCGNSRLELTNPGHHAVGRFLVYDRALTDLEILENYRNLKRLYKI